MLDLDRLASGACAGAIAGILMGAGARIAMRLVALIGGLHPEFTVSGTLIILLLFVVVGVPFGLLFTGAQRLLHVPPIVQGGLYGICWAVLVTIPFFRNPGGELALASPWVGASLFAPLPLLGGLLMGALAPHLNRRLQGQTDRTVPAAWLVSLLVAAVLAFVSMGQLMDPAARMPRAVWDLYSWLNIDFMDAREVNALLGVLFGLGYVGLALTLFFVAGQAPMGRMASLALLLFAAGFFNRSGLFVGVMDTLRLAAVTSGLLKAVGVTVLLGLLIGFPDGRLSTHSRWVLLSAGIGTLAWYVLPMDWQDRVPSGVQWLAASLLLVGGLVTQMRRYRSASSRQRRQLAVVFLGLGIPVLWLVSLWGASLIVPFLRFGRGNSFFAPLGVTVYLLPWLLPGLTLVHACLCCDLWAAQDERTRLDTPRLTQRSQYHHIVRQ